ncbi:MAG: hypothetical protein HYV13_02045 [Candidatus Doudnabacteria bacterium]|nr:hypothetical protein [Candidatus Doudnabacteria bacterium]
MAGIVLLVEDTQEEADSALRILKERGNKVLLAQTYEQARAIWETVDVQAILTDLFYPEKTGADATTPCGISIAIEAKMTGVPVAICSRVEHHSCEWLWKAWLSMGIPVSEAKDWQWTINQLFLILQGKQ